MFPRAPRSSQALSGPGPLTLVLKRAAHVSDAITGGQSTVGLRVPHHWLGTRSAPGVQGRNRRAVGESLRAPLSHDRGTCSGGPGRRRGFDTRRGILRNRHRVHHRRLQRTRTCPPAVRCHQRGGDRQSHRGGACRCGRRCTARIRALGRPLRPAHDDAVGFDAGARCLDQGTGRPRQAGRRACPPGIGVPTGGNRTSCASVRGRVCTRDVRGTTRTG